MSRDHSNHVDSPAADRCLDDPVRRRMLGGIAAFGVDLALGGGKPGLGVVAATHADVDRRVDRPMGGPMDRVIDRTLRQQVHTIIVIYAENRSCAHLFGNFPGVRYSLDAVSRERPLQFDRDGKTPLPVLPPIWGGLVPDAQRINGKRYMIGECDIVGLPNAPFLFRNTDGKPLPNRVVTQDPWHRFYQNQMQINAGRNDQFVAWSDAGALVMGHYRHSMETLRLWRLARGYTFCDNFFMAAFGGSWLNHIFLISAQAPLYPDVYRSRVRHLVSILEGDDPLGTRLKVAAGSPRSALDGPPIFENDGSLTPDGYVVNTMAPPFQPSEIPPRPGGDPAYADPFDPHVLPPQRYATIGDRLSEKGVEWAWYSGAWKYALDYGHTRMVPDFFQFHHQPFNYFANFAPGTEARRRHLRDAGFGEDPSTNHLLADIDSGRLPAVTFYKPQGNLNMHAGYADIETGDRHIANVIEHIRSGPQWKNTVIIVTFDENGGWWDPAPPPKGDRWGPGSRVPAIVIAPFAKQGYVDHTMYDTNSIVRFIGRVHGLVPLEGVVARDRAFAVRGAAPPGDLTNTLSFS